MNNNRYAFCFDIRLYGTTKDIEVRVYVEDDRFYGWDSLSTSKKQAYIQDIVDDILREFKNAKVSGYVENNKNYGKLTTFSVSNRGTVSLDNRYDDWYDDDWYRDDLERYLNDYFATSTNGIRDIKVSYIGDRVSLVIDVDYWNKNYASTGERQLLQDIGDYIVDRYSYNKYYHQDISGVVREYNGVTMYSFDYYSGGDLSINY